eukprot:TRINITY_DN10334_c0_g1_i1.p2 TRINITY_DN10334_c0_g1~~TRINITY_DN10334_c0_g1_i1.p2  ORF type:complete len:104 (+),score=5.42 TRINITY_DN10334_c0_g1_i1:92-403(+)
MSQHRKKTRRPTKHTQRLGRMRAQWQRGWRDGKESMGGGKGTAGSTESGATGRGGSVVCVCCACVDASQSSVETRRRVQEQEVWRSKERIFYTLCNARDTSRN